MATFRRAVLSRTGVTITHKNRDNKLMLSTKNFEQCFSETFCITDDESRGVYLTAASIFQELKQKYGAGMVGNSLLSFGRKLRNINGIKFHRTSKGTEYLVIRM